MKKISMFVITLSAVLSMSLFAGMKITENDLPTNAKDFIKKHFANATVSYAERDSDEYEVSLSDNTKISFMLNGDWKDVKGYNAIPTSFIPANVLNTVKKSYPDASIIEIDKKRGGNFKVQLDNMMEIYLNQAGVIMKQKFDD